MMQHGDSNSRPLGHESLPLTTRPVLPRIATRTQEGAIKVKSNSNPKFRAV